MTGPSAQGTDLLPDKVISDTILQSSHTPLTSNPQSPVVPSVANGERIFVPIDGTATPGTIFEVTGNNSILPGHRFICKNNPHTALIFIAGTAVDTDTSLSTVYRPQAGYGIVFAPYSWTPPISCRLECDGTPQTADRAQLRATLVALGSRNWYMEGFTTIIVATDSEYVVRGISGGMAVWKEDEWKTTTLGGKLVEIANRDMWEAVENMIRNKEMEGTAVKLWRITKEENPAIEWAKVGMVSVCFYSCLFVSNICIS